MITEKFDKLFEEYKNASYIGDRRIKVKLREIAACYDECNIAEREFTGEIIDKFCELIDLLEERNEQERQSLILKYENQTAYQANKASADLIAYQVGYITPAQEHTPYQSADELMVDFYNYFRNEQKKKSEIEKADYPPIASPDDLKEGIKVNSTMKDYVARLKTFTNNYMYDIPRIYDLWCSNTEKADAILFAYENLELILAHFNTRDENGNINKQKCNIQSALRKLNEFKRARELCSE